MTRSRPRAWSSVDCGSVRVVQVPRTAKSVAMGSLLIRVKVYVACTPDGPFVGWLHQDGPDEACDGLCVGAESDKFGAAFDWVGAVQFGVATLS